MTFYGHCEELLSPVIARSESDEAIPRKKEIATQPTVARNDERANALATTAKGNDNSNGQYVR